MCVGLESQILHVMEMLLSTQLWNTFACLENSLFASSSLVVLQHPVKNLPLRETHSHSAKPPPVRVVNVSNAVSFDAEVVPGNIPQVQGQDPHHSGHTGNPPSQSHAGSCQRCTWRSDWKTGRAVHHPAWPAVWNAVFPLPFSSSTRQISSGCRDTWFPCRTLPRCCTAATLGTSQVM